MYYWWHLGWYNEWTYAGRPRSDADRAAGADALPAHPDRRLERAVATALFDDSAVTGGDIELTVQNGVVILDGTVDSEPVRSAVVARAWSVPGVTDVCNALTVRRRRHRR